MLQKYLQKFEKGKEQIGKKFLFITIKKGNRRKSFGISIPFLNKIRYLTAKARVVKVIWYFFNKWHIYPSFPRNVFRECVSADRISVVFSFLETHPLVNKSKIKDRNAVATFYTKTCNLCIAEIK